LVRLTLTFWANYIDYLNFHPKEQWTSFDDKLIGVAGFFREPSPFQEAKAPYRKKHI
jgi:chemotaxis methyl-accepting protein methylase